eukprot:9492-Heterococcus_DN1.PRE.3
MATCHKISRLADLLLCAAEYIYACSRIGIRACNSRDCARTTALVGKSAQHKELDIVESAEHDRLQMQHKQPRS